MVVATLHSEQAMIRAQVVARSVRPRQSMDKENKFHQNLLPDNLCCGGRCRSKKEMPTLVTPRWLHMPPAANLVGVDRDGAFIILDEQRLKKKEEKEGKLPAATNVVGDSLRDFSPFILHSVQMIRSETISVASSDMNWLRLWRTVAIVINGGRASMAVAIEVPDMMLKSSVALGFAGIEMYFLIASPSLAPTTHASTVERHAQEGLYLSLH
ncbi:hypothetical protein LR48_Vigan09g095900 [Vigna angularis]|uniref:Uncharacterized protein n=1 Tax=Phaseolus angularis TaxID=3914 RepID=A0A0L9VB63_PHAAN|nr:hypothetical protein LR48_Vigan09g095900 [Vigna angularis]